MWSDSSWCVFVADARRETRERRGIHRLPARPDEAGVGVRILLPSQSAGGQRVVGYNEVHLLRYITFFKAAFANYLYGIL